MHNAYSLPRNHFHFIIKTKSTEAILQAALKDFDHITKTFFRILFASLPLSPNLDSSSELELLSFKNLVNLTPQTQQLLPPDLSPEELHKELAEWVLSERFRRFMMSYAKAINRQENRTGSLFQKLFRRKEVHGINNCKNVTIYIHRNAIHHGLCLELDDFPWSSYPNLLADTPTSLKRKTVLQWFDGKEAFLKLHLENVQNWKKRELYVMED